MNIVIAIILAGNMLGGRGFSSAVDDSLSSAVDLEKMFREIEHGIRTEDTRAITKHFGKQVFLSLQNIESAYYSSNQASFIVQDFFNTHHIITFKLSSVNSSEPSPYATGGGTIRVKNTREILQVYIGLTMADDHWVISEFNMY
jgi:hypothetical protein